MTSFHEIKRNDVLTYGCGDVYRYLCDWQACLKYALDHGISPTNSSHRQRMSQWVILLTYKEEGPHGHAAAFPAGLLPLVMIGHGIGIGG